MKYGFSVLERILLLKALPEENNVLTLRIIRKLKEEIGFTDEEAGKIVFVGEGNNFLAKEQTIPVKEIEISERATDIIRESLKKLNDGKRLTENHLSLYDKFMEQAA